MVHAARVDGQGGARRGRRRRPPAARHFEARRPEDRRRLRLTTRHAGRLVLSLVAGRLAQMAATLFVVSALVWLVMGLMPGDPVDLAMMSDPAHRGRIERGCARARPRPAAAWRYLAWARRGAARRVRLLAPLRRAGGAGAVAGARLHPGAARRFPRAGGGARHRARRAGRGAAALGAGRGRASRCWRNPCPASGSASC